MAMHLPGMHDAMGSILSTEKKISVNKTKYLVKFSLSIFHMEFLLAFKI